jgi:murein DD-endopeptidase MepM/ murein hydrolase activator NlpD
LTSSIWLKALQSRQVSSLVSGASAVQALAHRHPRRVSALVLSLLAGSAFTAFGVSPLSALPQAPAPVVKAVQEEVQAPGLALQLSTLSEQTLALYRSEITRSSDTVDSLLQRLGVDDVQAAQFIRNDATAGSLLQGRAGKLVKAMVEGGQLQELVVRGPVEAGDDFAHHFLRVTVSRVQGAAPARWNVRKEVLPLETVPQMASGVIQSSLYAAADDASIPDGVTNQVAEIFGNDIDFRHELRKGDTFSVLYETHLADGEPVTWPGSTGRVLAARFINKGELHDAVWFQEAGRKGTYYDLHGRSKVRAFLASPLAFSRVTSGFAMRFHPILQKWRAHLGVDFGAPTGTPVRTVGDGVVTFAGRQNGYGNVVQVQHSAGRMTVYAHLSRMDVRQGQHVEQGVRIGAVGATGWATGPHLHFEFKTNGHQVDPMTIARASESLQLSPAALSQFRRMVPTVAQRLDVASQWRTAGATNSQRFE